MTQTALNPQSLPIPPTVIIGDCWLWRGDCLDILPTLPRVDACVTDPPYGIGESSKNFASRSKLANADKYKRTDWDAKPCPQRSLR